MNYKNRIFKLGLLGFFLSLSFLFGSLALADSCACLNGTIVTAQCGVLCDANCGGFALVRSCVNTAPISPIIVSGNPDSGDSKTVNAKSGDSVTIKTLALPNPLGITDPNALIAQLINFTLSLVGSISLLLFVYGGIIWMTSAGSPEKIKKGRDIIVWAVIGLAVVFMSYILVRFVIQGLTGA